MRTKLELKLVVLEDGVEVSQVVLSFEAASDIVSIMPDNERYSALYAHMARHPSDLVREHVAEKDSISYETVDMLLADRSLAVLGMIVRNQKFRENASLEQLGALIERDAGIARWIAGFIREFSAVSTNKLAIALANHSDPSVVYYLADNYTTPKNILKTLTMHADARVANAATRSLEKVRLGGSQHLALARGPAGR